MTEPSSDAQEEIEEYAAQLKKLVERNRQYLDGHAGKNDLKVGPLMLAHALEESTDCIEALKQHAPDALLRKAHDAMAEADFEGQFDEVIRSINDYLATRPKQHAPNALLRKPVDADLVALLERIQNWRERPGYEGECTEALVSSLPRILAALKGERP